MQLKYVHPIMLKYKDVFVRSNRLDGSFFATTYEFSLDIPFLGNKPLVHYDNVANSSTDAVYDYSALLKAETVHDAYKILESKDLFKSYRIASIKVKDYEKMMTDNVLVAHRLKELRQQDDMLAIIEEV